MDKFDLKIIKELEKDSRMPSSRIGKKISRSQQFVDYRINLLRTGKYKGDYWPGSIITPQIIINQFKLNLRSFLLFVKLDDAKKIPSFFEKAKNSPSVNWIITTGYESDFIIMLTSKDVKSLYSHITNLFKGETLFDFDLREIVKHQMQDHGYLTGNKIVMENSVLSGGEKLDKTDVKILIELKKRYDIKLVNISNNLGLNYRTVKSRIERMEKLKIITGYRPFINPEALGYRSYFIKFTTNIQADYELDKFLRFLSENKNITDSFEFLGRFSNAVIYRYKSEESTKKFLEELRKVAPKLQDLSVFPLFDDSLYTSVI